MQLRDAHPVSQYGVVRVTLLIVGPDVGAVGIFLQCLTVDDGDVAAPRGDEAGLFQALQGDRHARTMGAEHEAEELMREGNVAAVEAIISHEQPTRQSLLDVAAAVGERGCRGLSQKSMCEAQHGAMKSVAPRVGFQQAGRADTQSRAGDLDIGCVLGPIASQMIARPVMPSRPMMPTQCSVSSCHWPPRRQGVARAE
jgi:hypothetical protein